MNELGAALSAFDADDAIGAIVVTGSAKAFAAGADIAAMAKWSYMDVYRTNYITRNWETIRTVRKPVIAAVGGFALGRRLRARDDVRHRDRRGRRALRSTRDQARHHPRRGRHATPASRGGQGEGDGPDPDRPHDERRGGRARRPRVAHRAGGQAGGRSGGGRRNHRRVLAALGDDGQGSRQPRVRRNVVGRRACSSGACSIRCSPPRTRRSACRRSWTSRSRTSNTSRERDHA